MKIRAIGNYWPQDDAGYLLRDCAWEKVPIAWRPLVLELGEAYQARWGTQLHSVYLRGSVARGQVVKGISDLDTFAVLQPEVAPQHRWLEVEWEEKQLLAWREHYPFVTDIEGALTSLSAPGELLHPHVLPILQFQSLRLWGESLDPYLPRFRPGPALARNHRWLAEDWGRLQNDSLAPATELRSLLKTILRAAFELVMEREQRFTLDLYLCYRSFAQYYPEWEAEMRQVLEFFLQAPDSAVPLQKLALGLGQWMIGEAKVLFPAPP